MEEEKQNLIETNIIGKRKITPQERYAAKYKRQIKIDCFVHTEKDILAKLDSVPNRAGYIKRLIREDIARGRKKDIAID